jgi:opacity protein-like surface antigen
LGSRDSDPLVDIEELNRSNPRRHSLLLVALLSSGLFCAAGSHAQEPADTPFFVVGIGAGAISIDLPHPEEPGEDFGTRFRTRFDIGFRPATWLELGVELGLAQLGASDSVNAILEAGGLPQEAAYTFVDWNVGARMFMPGTARWTPWVRGALGQAWLKLSAPQGYREQDLAWALGVGLDFEPMRSLLLRSEARYLGQQTSGDPASHLSVDLGIFYALRRSQFD